VTTKRGAKDTDFSWPVPRLEPAYLAGIIDGEGSVFARKRNPHLSVSNTCEALIDELVKFGGHGTERRPERGIGTKPGWDWTICGEAAAIVLRACLPYMIVKRERTLEVLEQWEQVTGSNHAHFAERARDRFARVGWPAA
jgi:hypothetical protein